MAVYRACSANRTSVFLYCLLCIISYAKTGDAQTVLVTTNEWNVNEVYRQHFEHTAWKSLLLEDTINTNRTGGILGRKIFKEHLFNIEKEGVNLYFDILPDFSVGKSSRGVSIPWINTRAFKATGSVGKKLYFEVEDYENQQRFPGYVDSYAKRSRVIPHLGQFLGGQTNATFDYNYTSGRIIYRPYNWLRFDMGYGKNFIGDGYRSLLLSDWSFNYPYLKTSFTWKTLEYSVMWNQYISQIEILTDQMTFLRKWGQTYFLDWKATKKLNIALYESVIWPDQDSSRNKDVSPWLASPVIFAHGSNTSSGASNGTVTGINAKYEVANHNFIYGQLVVNNIGKYIDWKKEYAFQLGLRSIDIGGVHNLNANVEYNQAQPYMYTSGSLNTNYAHYNQPLADPLGAGFKEGILVVSYQYKKWWVRGEAMIARYSRDTSANQQGGSDIFKTDGTKIAGLNTKLYYGDLRVAYILNPKINLRIEASLTYRKENNTISQTTDKVFMIGIRSSFRSLYYDF